MAIQIIRVCACAGVIRPGLFRLNRGWVRAFPRCCWAWPNGTSQFLALFFAMLI